MGHPNLGAFITHHIASRKVASEIAAEIARDHVRLYHPEKALVTQGTMEAYVLGLLNQGGLGGGSGGTHNHMGTGTDSTIISGLTDSTLPDASGATSFAGADGAVAAGYLSIALGYLANTDVTAARAIAIGYFAAVTGQKGIAVGGNSSAVDYAVAMGDFASAQALNDVSIGQNSNANGGGSAFNSCTTVGSNATSGPWDQNVSIGDTAQTVSVDYSTALGAEASCSSSKATSVGNSATVNTTADFGTALGYNAQVASGHDHSTTLGPNSATTKAHQVIVGTINEVVSHPGGVEFQVLTKTNLDYTLKVTDHTVRFSTGATNRVATLPAVTTAIVGLTYIIKKVDAGVGLVTVTADTSGTADLIDGAATKVLTNQYDVIVLYAAAADTWDVIKGPGAP